MMGMAHAEEHEVTKTRTGARNHTCDTVSGNTLSNVKALSLPITICKREERKEKPGMVSGNGLGGERIKQKHPPGWQRRQAQHI